MARTASFRSLARLMRAALLAERRHCSTADALEAIQELTSSQMSPSISRRQLLVGVRATGATLALGTMTGLPPGAAAKPSPSSLSVGIVGTELAGLACADALIQDSPMHKTSDAGTVRPRRKKLNPLYLHN